MKTRDFVTAGTTTPTKIELHFGRGVRAASTAPAPSPARICPLTRLAVAVATLALALLPAGCESLLDVEPPDRVGDAVLEDPTTAELQVGSVIASFECALAEYIGTTGEVSDEFVNSNLRSSQAFDFDARRITSDQENYSLFDCGQFNAIYLPLSIALTQGEETLENLRGWNAADVPNRDDLIAVTLAYSAYARVLLGESFCSAAINLSAEMSSDAILADAESRFSEALSGAMQVGNTQIAAMARVGRARARRDLGDMSGAMSDAEAVPEGFAMNANYSSLSTRSMNTVYRTNNQTHFESVDPRFRELEWKGVPDPRVSTRNTGQLGFGRVYQVWEQLKYLSLDDPIPIATWDEAQLVIAEAAGGQRAVDIINAFHDAAGIPGYDPATDIVEGPTSDNLLNMIIQERSRELFLEGHRFWDHRSLEIALDPPPGAPYPKGGAYGSMRCFPLPDVEKNNNPNIPS